MSWTPDGYVVSTESELIETIETVTPIPIDCFGGAGCSDNEQFSNVSAHNEPRVDTRMDVG